VVVHETYQNKVSAKIRFINLPGAGGLKNQLDRNQAKQILGSVELKAALMAARQDMQSQGLLPQPATSAARPAAIEPDFDPAFDADETMTG
jgi:hypothetical protein